MGVLQKSALAFEVDARVWAPCGQRREVHHAGMALSKIQNGRFVMEADGFPCVAGLISLLKATHDLFSSTGKASTGTHQKVSERERERINEREQKSGRQRKKRMSE